MEKGTITSINWSSLALRGLMVNLFALVFLFYPVVSLKIRILLFALFTLLFGVFSIVPTLRVRITWILILEVLQGVVSIAISLAAFSLSGLTNAALIYLIAAWAILIGALKITLGFFWSNEIPHQGLPKINGIMAMLLGVFLIVIELSGADMLLVSAYIGVYTFIFGLSVLVFAMHLRELQAAAGPRPPSSRPGAGDPCKNR